MSEKHSSEQTIPVHRWEFRQPIPTDPRFIDLTGQPFERLWVLGYAGKKGEKFYWWCRCTCKDETIKIVWGGNLQNGHVRSCHCLMIEINRTQQTTHGLTGRPEHIAHRNMIRRCYNKKDDSYKYYGERGIKVCDRWRGKDGLKNFYTDMGPRPGVNYEIDRKNNDGDYTPENCRWVKRKKNARNRRSNIQLTLNGKTRTMTYWSEKQGIKFTTLRARKKLGWSDERALTTPVKSQA